MAALDAAADAADDGVFGFVGDVDGDIDVFADLHIKAVEASGAAGQHETAVNDIRGEFGWRALENAGDAVKDNFYFFPNGVSDVV